MARKLQWWRPDTCGCRIAQTHDPSDPQAAIEFGGMVEPKCADHASLTPQEIWDAVWTWPYGENRRKNLVWKRIQEIEGVEITWSWQGSGTSRVCIVTATGVSAQKKALAQSWCDTNIGPGKVLIQ